MVTAVDDGSNHGWASVTGQAMGAGCLSEIPRGHLSLGGLKPDFESDLVLEVLQAVELDASCTLSEVAQDQVVRAQFRVS